MNRAQPQGGIGVGELLPVFQRLCHGGRGRIAQGCGIEDGVGIRNVGLCLDQTCIGHRGAADRTDAAGANNALRLFGAGPLKHGLIGGNRHIGCQGRA